MSFNQAKAKGFSLIELLLVLGVLAILLVAAFVVYPQVRDRNQANAEVSNLTAIKANITNLYASRGGNYGGLNRGVANQARVFPSSMNGGVYTAGADITTAWGGGVWIGRESNSTDDVVNGERRYSIRYEGVPAGVCLGLVSGAASNFQDVRVSDLGSTTGSVFTDGQFDPGLAATECANNPNGAQVTFISN